MKLDPKSNTEYLKFKKNICISAVVDCFIKDKHTVAVRIWKLYIFKCEVNMYVNFKIIAQ